MLDNPNFVIVLFVHCIVFEDFYLFLFLGFVIWLEMENSEVRNGDSSQCVRVAVNVRPLITPELLLGCTDCISVVPGEPQVPMYIYTYIFDWI